MIVAKLTIDLIFLLLYLLVPLHRIQTLFLVPFFLSGLFILCSLKPSLISLLTPSAGDLSELTLQGDKGRPLGQAPGGAVSRACGVAGGGAGAAVVVAFHICTVVFLRNQWHW